MGEKRKQTRAAALVGTVYKGFKVLDCKTENRRSFLQVECPYCKKIKWIFFSPYPKINNASGHILQNLRKTVNRL